MVKVLYKIQRGIVVIYSWIINRVHLFICGAKVGRNFGSCGTLFLRNYGKKGSIKIGDQVFVNSARMANPIGGDTKTIMVVCENGSLTLGNRVKISNATFFSMTEISVGDDTFIGGGTRIYDTDFHSCNPEYRCQWNTHIPVAPVKIGNRCFIGSNVQILKGVTIGDESVVGAGSVVTKSIPSRQIWAGNPAKFIKSIE